ncbi:PAS domain S-box protein [Myxococcus sp. SDU36]|uniref:PAS domain S-box protein n=1 Tax=Myxococcus sp. SDU36 TaxID=2831967 RepID=UPI0025433103|nr:PAS domain S-box protein [Myxococcus sp. SDU36]
MGARRAIAGRRKSGEEFPAEASISKVKVDGTTLLTVVLRDISARTRAEEVLRNSEARFRTAFEDAPIGIALIGLDGRFLNVNGALCDIVGYPPEELLTRTVQDITWQEDLALDLANAQRLLAGEVRSFQREKRYLHRQGHLVSVRPAGDRGPRPGGRRPAPRARGGPRHPAHGARPRGPSSRPRRP